MKELVLNDTITEYLSVSKYINWKDESIISKAEEFTLGDMPETGFCVHALNAVYIKPLDRWIRLDARGNKAGVDAQFDLE